MARSGRPPGLSADDRLVWRYVTRDVRPLAAHDHTPQTPTARDTPQPMTPPPSGPRAQGGSCAPEPASFPPLRDPHTALDRFYVRKARKKGGIDATLDLHGLRVDEAHHRLIHFIANARAHDARLVSVVTGKGRDGQGILKRLLPDWLNRAPLVSQIVAYASAPHSQGGEGAVLIQLRRNHQQVV